MVIESDERRTKRKNSRNNESENSEEKMQSPPNSEALFPLFDLPRHLVLFIAEKMCAAARICLKIAVRESLKISGAGGGQALWGALFSPRSSEYELSDPLFRWTRAYTVEGNFQRSHPGAVSEICASKYGWLLVAEKYSSHGITRTSFLFFNPFTNTTAPIALPTLGGYFHSATFSGPPTSGEGTLFVFSILRNRIKPAIRISICRYGDTKWSTLQEFDIGPFRGKNEPKSAVHIGGKFYCLCPDGDVVVFSVEDGKLSQSKLPSVKYDCWISVRSIHLLESDDGQLLVLTRVTRFVRGRESGILWCLSRFDFAQMTWVDDGTSFFLDRAVYVGSRNCYSVPAFGKMSHLANRIYYHKLDSTPGFCSFRTQTCYKANGHGWIEEKKLSSMKLHDKKIWIEPPP